MEQLTLQTPDGPLEYSITHRPRVTRRLHLELDANGDLLVVVPESTPATRVEAFLLGNVARVKRFLQSARAAHLPPLRYTDGSSHLYRGQECHLQLIPSHSRGMKISYNNGLIRVRTNCNDPEHTRTGLANWYRQQAAVRFQERLDHWAARADWVGRKQLQLKLRRMKATWGTCNIKGVIRLNTHLEKAPEAVLDYVISHELCHLQEMNHGPRFYALQEALYPGWQKMRLHLRHEGRIYTRD